MPKKHKKQKAHSVSASVTSTTATAEPSVVIASVESMMPPFFITARTITTNRTLMDKRLAGLYIQKPGINNLAQYLLHLREGILLKSPNKGIKHAVCDHLTWLDKYISQLPPSDILAHFGYYLVPFYPGLEKPYQEYCIEEHFKAIEALDIPTLKSQKKKIIPAEDFDNLLRSFLASYIIGIHLNLYAPINEGGKFFIRNLIMSKLAKGEDFEPLVNARDKGEKTNYWILHQHNQALFNIYPMAPLEDSVSRCEDLIKIYEEQYLASLKLTHTPDDPFPFEQQVIVLSTFICMVMESNPPTEVNPVALKYITHLRIAVGRYKHRLESNGSKNKALAYYYLTEALFADHVMHVNPVVLKVPGGIAPPLVSLSKYEEYAETISEHYLEWKEAAAAVGRLSQMPFDFCMESPLRNYSRIRTYWLQKLEQLKAEPITPENTHLIGAIQQNLDNLTKEEHEVRVKPDKELQKYNTNLSNRLVKIFKPLNAATIETELPNVFSNLMRMAKEEHAVAQYIVYGLFVAVLAYSYDNKLVFKKLARQFFIEEPITPKEEGKEEGKEEKAVKKAPVKKISFQPPRKKVSNEEVVERVKLLREAQKKSSHDDFLTAIVQTTLSSTSVSSPKTKSAKKTRAHVKKIMRPESSTINLSPTYVVPAKNPEKISNNFSLTSLGTSPRLMPRIPAASSAEPMSIPETSEPLPVPGFSKEAARIRHLLTRGFSAEEFFGDNLSAESRDIVVSLLKSSFRNYYEARRCFGFRVAGSSVFEFILRICYPDSPRFSPNDMDIHTERSKCGEQTAELLEENEFSLMSATTPLTLDSILSYSKTLQRRNGENIACEVSITPDRHLSRFNQDNSIDYSGIKAALGEDGLFYLNGLNPKIYHDLAAKIFDLRRPHFKDIKERYLILRTVKQYNSTVLRSGLRSTEAVISVLGRDEWLGLYLGYMFSVQPTRCFKEIARIIDWQKNYIKKLRKTGLSIGESLTTILPILTSFFMTILVDSEHKESYAKRLTTHLESLISDENREFQVLDLATFDPSWFKRIFGVAPDAHLAEALRNIVLKDGPQSSSKHYTQSSRHLFLSSSSRTAPSSSSSSDTLASASPR